jgi:hypothetical protein
MPLEIKANSWYRTRGGEIAYVAAIAPGKHRCPVLGCKKSMTLTWDMEGRYFGDNTKADNDIVEHLPDCDGFDWVPTPKIQLEFNGKHVQANGEIVGPISVLHSSEFCYDDIKLARVWNESGIRLNDDKRATENIVSEYVEPEPVYEPWDFESMPVAVKVKAKSYKSKYMSTVIPHCDCVSSACGQFFAYQVLFDHYTQLDGTPCGKMVQP